ncbi:enoyl-CoA hydratase/isomerase family protein [Mycobacterium sp. SMC-4]|uniref:enoyl-CoA hydratase/isomerase family protein n=1 Tax=Mycobacterium sp. SMC-4 TaxID=2857059 RepID=UPI0021B4C3EA|nr:enoyl-CoA hydratase-related protein [Mycobacterium sp. SMC-4]UXA16122.1 enoyl-CoA hydratase/isomerase family protein [Mycobacterium sp. SMC-4]
MTDLTVSVSDGVAVVTLNRPDRRNAYTAAMGELLGEAYRRCDQDDRVRAIVLTGAGDAFCVGADVEGPRSPFDAPAAEFTASPVDPAAFELRTPVIAAVNGHAVGIGLTIALQADIRIMALEAKYAVAQVRRGVLGDCMSHWTLPHLVGTAVAADLLLTGRTFDGAEAASFGLASRAVAASEVLDQAVDVARDIALHVAPMSAALSKRLLWDTVMMGYRPRQVAHLETELHRRVMGGADAIEGVAAFVQRRDPRWTTSVSARWQPLPEPPPV